MERTQELFERIENYLNNSLSPDEKAAFEREIIRDVDLQREVDLHQSLLSTLMDFETINYRRKITEIAKTLKEENNSNKKLRLWKTVAVFAILIGVSALVWLQKGSTNSRLFEKYYKVYPVNDLVRGEEKNSLRVTLDKYDAGNFLDVIPELNEYVKKYPNDAILKLYLGNCFLQTNQEKKAITIFENISIQNSAYENAQWYLALSYIKNDKEQKAVAVLEGLLEFHGVHRKNAQSLMSELQ